MIKLSDTIKRIYDSVINLANVEVLTDTGFKEAKSLNIIGCKEVYEIKTNKNKKLICTNDHIIISEDNLELFAKDSINRKIKTIDGIEKIISVKKIPKKEKVYDLTVNDDNNLYYCNGILSHNCVIIDEMAFIPRNVIDEFFASVMPVISSSKNSKAIVVSTPNGTTGLYYELWQAANSRETGKNTEGWSPFRIDWWETGGIRDESWKEKQIASIGIDRWRQEFGNEFISTSFRKLIPDDIIENFRKKLADYKKDGTYYGKKCKIISENENKVYEFTMWHEFNPEKTYLASGDVGEGNGSDSSVLYIWDITDIRQITMCAKFASPDVSVIEFAYLTRKILELYNDPFYSVENNAVGSGYVDALAKTYGFTNFVRENKDNNYGVRSHVIIKGKACLWLKEMCTTDGIGWKIYDKYLLDEMTTFVKKDSKVHTVYNAIKGEHDDLICSMMWCAWILQPDIIDTYYITVESFVTALDKIMPKIIHPMYEYSVQEINKIYSNRIFEDFIEYKNEKKKECLKDDTDEKNPKVEIINSSTYKRSRQYKSSASLMQNVRPYYIHNSGGWTTSYDSSMFNGPSWN